MKASFEITNINLNFDNPKEVAAIATLLLNTSHEELSARDKNFATIMNPDEYINLVANVFGLTAELGIHNINGDLSPNTSRVSLS